MKYTFSLIFVASLLFTACGGEPKATQNADGSASFGAAITADGAMPIAQLAEKMTGKPTLENIKIEAPITAACQKKGCWMDVKNGESTVKVTFKDYAFFVPKDCSGKTAIMEGKAFMDTTSVADLRHYAEDGGMSKEEAEKKYTQPEVELRFEATGVLIK